MNFSGQIFCAILFFCFWAGFKTKSNNFHLEPGYVIDSTFKLSDSLHEIICLKYNAFDSNSNHTLHFKYFIQSNANWILKNEYDSLDYWDEGFLAEHTDYDNDGIDDFAFLAKQGMRGLNSWDHIFLYRPKEKSFYYLKGSREICAPWFDKTKNKLVGILNVGNRAYKTEYEIQKDSVIEKSYEIWENDAIIKESN